MLPLSPAFTPVTSIVAEWDKAGSCSLIDQCSDKSTDVSLRVAQLALVVSVSTFPSVSAVDTAGSMRTRVLGRGVRILGCGRLGHVTACLREGRPLPRLRAKAKHYHLCYIHRDIITSFTRGLILARTSQYTAVVEVQPHVASATHRRSFVQPHDLKEHRLVGPTLQRDQEQAA